MYDFIIIFFQLSAYGDTQICNYLRANKSGFCLNLVRRLRAILPRFDFGLGSCPNTCSLKTGTGSLCMSNSISCTKTSSLSNMHRLWITMHATIALQMSSSVLKLTLFRRIANLFFNLAKVFSTSIRVLLCAKLYSFLEKGIFVFS